MGIKPTLGIFSSSGYFMKKQIHIKLNEELHKEVRLKAAEVGYTIQEYVVNSLQLCVKEQLALYQSKPDTQGNGEHRFSFIDLFSGIGGTRIAFEQAGGKCVFSSEWDEHCKRTYFANFGEFPRDDITKIDEQTIPDHKVLIAGFPCQPFSIAGVSKKNSLGKEHGFLDTTQGTLFFDIARILKVKKPPVFLLENVKNLLRHDKGKTFEVICETLKKLNYNIRYEIVDAASYVPQHRERLFIVGLNKKIFGKNTYFEFPDHPNLNTKIKSILDKHVESKYTLSDKLWSYLQKYAEKHKAKGNGFGYGLVNLNGIARTLSARYYKDGSEILIPQKNKNPRRLTPIECARLMGFPENFRIPVSDTQAYKQFGNTVVVPVVETLANHIKFQLEHINNFEKNKDYKHKRN